MKQSTHTQLGDVKRAASRVALGGVILFGLLSAPSLGQAAKMEPNLTKLLGQAAAYQAKGQVIRRRKY